MRPVETTVIIVYLLVMTVIGIYFSRKALSTEDDYWLAGRSVNGFVGSFAVFAAVASGGSMYGAIGSGVAYGVPYYLATGLGSVALFPFALFLFAAQMRRSGVTTLPAYFGKRFGNSVRIVSAVLIVILMTIYIVPQLTTVGYVGSYVLGWPYALTVIVIGAGMTLYASIGGMWAITYTDLIQGIMMVAGVAVLAVVIIVNHGGVPNVIDAALSVNPNAFDATLPWYSYFALFFVFLWFAVVTPAAVMRTLSAKNARHARLSMIGGTLLFAVLFMTGAFVLMAGIGLSDTFADNNDIAFLRVIEVYLSPVIAGILLSSILASIMSSTDAFLLAASSGVAHDLYKGHINKNAPEKKVTRIGLVVMLLAATIAIVLSLNPPPLLHVMIAMIGGALVSSFSAPILLGLWWKRANKPGALAGVIGGITVYVGAMLLPLEVINEVMFATPVSFALTIIVSLLTPPPSEEVQHEVELNHTAIKDAQ
ncbi:sodium:solute symporter family protein [Aquibacillus sediminis]|uniref:sodium:solute symporter family protein n=1 Tax=Aquibacillus sediminis TaxID=2574734 RepID=UPI0011098BCE|nr:sodium/solute symporter [Aquibacillus sediminis]